jgi:hypothetical protein
VLVSDSNYDWGQGIPDLLAWRGRKGLSQVDVWYFGLDPQIASPPLRRVALHQCEAGSADDLLRAVDGRYLAVGATIVHGGYVSAEGDAPSAALVRYLRNEQPVDRAGTFLIYDLARHPRWASARGSAGHLAASPRSDGSSPR